MPGPTLRAVADPFVKPETQYLLAVDLAHYEGEPVAVVLADSRYAAEDAAERVAVDYEPLPAVTDAWAAVGDGPGHTFPALRPIARIDHVLVSADVRPEAAAVVATRASDHRPLVVDVDLPDEAPLFA